MTADSVKNKLQALIARANAKTGASDGNLTAAVDRLAAGYGAGQNFRVIPVTLPETVGGTAAVNQVILSGNDFVQAHHADDGFFALWIPLNGTAISDTGAGGAIWVGNRPLLTAKYTVYGLAFRSTGAANAPVMVAAAEKISRNGYNITLRATSAGNIHLYVAANYYMPAGDYLLVLAAAEV